MRPDLLHVVTGFSNPRRYAVRPRLLREWVPHMLDSGVCLTVVEHAFGERPFEFSQEEFPHVRLVQLRGGPEHELWLRDGLVNYGFSTLPDTAKYLCWADSDIRHTRADWATETVHMLQHYRVGQTWTHCSDLDPKGNIARNEWGHEVDRAFCAAWLAGDVEIPDDCYAPVQSRAMLTHTRPQDWRAHTGYSWAIRRDALRGIGKLIDWMVTGSSDWHMALGFVGKLRSMVEKELANGGAERFSPGYYRRLREFATRCDEHIRQDIGCVDGTLLHGWHGSKKTRFYGARTAVLTESRFDPDTDLASDIHGLPTLISDNRLLRDGLRRYNTMRNEDSIDL